MKKKILLIVLPIILISGILLGGSYFVNNRYVNTEAFYEGVSIDNISLDGLTKEEALDFVKAEKETKISDKGIDLVYDDFSHRINLDDIGYTYNYEEVVDEAYEIGRDGGFFSRIRTIWNLRDNPIDLNLSYSYNKESIDKIADSIDEELLVEPVDANISISNDNIDITDDVTGVKLVKDELIDLIVENIETLENVEIPVEFTEANITADYLGQINGVIGSYTTSFAGSSEGRKFNIKHSTEPFDNMIIMPGEEISFNDTTGPRSTSNGYRQAPVIVNGQLQPGVGGGVCQTSTTLYNTLLLADVTVTQRSPHSIAQAYVPKGQDGAVADGYLDLKFKNDYEFPIYIKSHVSGNNVEFLVYGDTTVKDYTIRIEPELVATVPYETIEEVDNSLAPGSRELVQEGRTGYRVRTYRSIIKDEAVIEREEISFDYYPKRDFIYKVGPKATAPSTAPVNESPADEDSTNEAPGDEASEGEDTGTELP